MPRTTSSAVPLLNQPIKETKYFRDGCSDLRVDLFALFKMRERGRVKGRIPGGVFDPLDLISNLHIHGKTCGELKSVGTTKFQSTSLTTWIRWIKQLSKLNQVRTPHCCFPGYERNCFETLQLHVFVDASESIFAGVAYFRVVDYGQPRCSRPMPRLLY